MIDEAAAWSPGQMPSPEPKAVIILTHHRHSLTLDSGEGSIVKEIEKYCIPSRF